LYGKYSKAWINAAALYNKLMPPTLTSHHNMQIGLFFLFLIASTMLMITQGIGLTPDRYLVVLFAGTLIIGKVHHFIRDFTPFILLLVAYDFLRGFADKLNPVIHYTEPILITKLMFFGHNPTVDLQNWLYHPGHLAWYDYAGSILYLLHFAVPLGFAFYLWFYNRNHFRVFMLALMILSYLALLIYILFPSSPPWLASQKGYMPPVTKIFNVVMANFPENIHLPTIYLKIQANLVAAIPSMHSGYSFLVALFGWHFFKKVRWIFILYPLAMWITIIYMGEHYVIDIIAGVLLTLISYKLSFIVAKKYAKMVRLL
jgi:hypothetical protein